LACWLSVVSARIGVKRSSLRASRINAMPSILGMLMSVMIRSGRSPALSLPRAASPSGAVSTL